MEVTLEVVHRAGNSGEFISFNPYSNGSYSGRLSRLGMFISIFCVSILILMEVTLEGNDNTLGVA